MAARDYYFQLLRFTFLILQILVDLCEGAWWKFTGYPPEVSPENGQSPGHVEIRKVIFRTPDTRLGGSFQLEEFVSVHCGYYPIEYLSKTNVSLYTVFDNFVYFVETSCHDELRNLRKYPFTCIGQRVFAEKLIKAHPQDLIEFTENLPRPSCEILWIFHSSRCGSTALAQAINAIDGWTAVSEITWLIRVLPARLVGAGHEEIKSYMTSREFYRFAKSCLVSQLRHYTAHDKVCWKMDVTNAPYLLPLISTEFPECKTIFMTRQGSVTAQSIYHSISFQLGLVAKSLQLGYFECLKVNCDLMKTVIVHGMLTPEVKEFYTCGGISEYVLGYMLWASYLALLIDIHRSFPNIQALAIDYEYFRSNLHTSLEKIFEYAGIDERHLHISLQSFSVDSQEKSDMSRNLMSQRKVWKPDAQTVEKCNKFSKILGLPPHGEKLTREVFGLKNWSYLME